MAINQSIDTCVDFKYMFSEKWDIDSFVYDWYRMWIYELWSLVKYPAWSHLLEGEMGFFVCECTQLHSKKYKQGAENETQAEDGWKIILPREICWQEMRRTRSLLSEINLVLNCLSITWSRTSFLWTGPKEGSRTVCY